MRGLTGRINRLELESAAYAKVLDLDLKIETREGDFASADYLRNEIAGKRDALQKDQDEIAASRERLKELQNNPP